MKYWNGAFWLLFVIMGALIATSSFLRVLFLDIILGFLVVAVGIMKLSEEFASRSVDNRHKNIHESINFLSHRLDNGDAFNTRIKERHENRFMHLDRKRVGIERTMEDNYDSLAKKIIQQENKLNDVTKALVEVSKKHDAFAKESARELKRLERLKEKADKMHADLKKLQAKALKAGKAK